MLLAIFFEILLLSFLILLICHSRWLNIVVITCVIIIMKMNTCLSIKILRLFLQVILFSLLIFTILMLMLLLLLLRLFNLYSFLNFDPIRLNDWWT